MPCLEEFKALWWLKVFFIFVDGFNLKHDSLSPVAFLAVHPFVCVHLCGYQHMCGSRSLGAAAFPCLMALKGLCRARKTLRICSYHPFFNKTLSQALLPRQGCARLETALLFGAAVAARGWPCCPGWWGDAAKPGRAALVGRLPTFHLLWWDLPTSARENQKKRICTPQHAVAMTNRGTERASSLLYVVLHFGGVWNIHLHYQFHRHFLPLLAASCLTLS